MNSERITSNGSSPRSMQRTLRRSVGCSGVALHSGENVVITLCPAKCDTGIVFERVDVDEPSAIIPATWDKVVDTRLCSTIGNDHGMTVATIEHLMAALAGCGVDNAVIKINGPEVPIMDGSSGPFVFLIECAGLVELEAPRKVIRVLKEVEVKIGESRAVLKPSDKSFFDVNIDFKGTAASDQALQIGLINGNFCKELAQARTFGFLHEVEALRAAGLAKGGSLDNAIVVDGKEILNKDGLRFEDEFVRHKMLDAVGDLYLAGAFIIGGFLGWKCGHTINNKLLRALFADVDAWCYDFLSGDEVENSVDGGIPAMVRAVA